MTTPVPAFTYLGCHLIMDNQRKCQLDYYCEKTRHYNLLYDPFYTLGSSRNYALCLQIVKYTCHFHYIKIIMVPCVVSISNDNYYFLFIVLLCLMLLIWCINVYCNIIFIKCMHSILTCLLMDLVASYLSVYGSVQPIHSEAPVARSREFQIRLFVIHSSPPVIKKSNIKKCFMWIIANMDYYSEWTQFHKAWILTHFLYSSRH